MSVASMLLHMARQVLEGQVKPGLKQQLDQLENAVKNPIKGIAELVSGGSIWKGKSSQVFVQVVNNRVMKGLNVSSQHIITTQRNIQRAVEIMDRADAEVNSQVNSLADTFASIY